MPLASGMTFFITRARRPVTRLFFLQPCRGSDKFGKIPSKDAKCHGIPAPLLCRAVLQAVPARPRQQKGGFEYFYTIDASNFHSLPPEKQKKRIGNFFDLLRSLEKQIRITFTRKAVPLMIDGRTEKRHVLQVRISSHEPLTGMLDRLLYEYTVDYEHPRIRPDGERLGYLKYPEGYLRCLSLYDVPARLRWAWVHEVFANCGQIDVWIEPMDKESSLNTMRRKRSMLVRRAETDRRAAEEFRQAEDVEERLHKGADRLYRFGMTATVYGKTLGELNANTREFKKSLRVTGGSFDATISRQGMLYHGRWIHYVTCDQSFLSIVYPFVSAEMIETPNGVLLGYNMDTGGPAIYDIVRRQNGNVAIIGASGSGKSFAAKLFVKRLIQRLLDRDGSGEGPAVYVVDPMGEYHRHREYYGLDGMVITGEEELGIDPFKILKPADAAAVLAGVTHAEEDNKAVANEFFRHADRAGSVHEMYDMVSDESRRYLQHLVSGPLARIMQGKSKITDRTIIAMNGASGKQHEVLVLLLVLNKIWNRVVELPEARQKIIVVDEAWLLSKMPGAMAYIDQIVRMGRKINVKFVYISQRVDDISQDHGAEGKVIDNVGTKILMNLGEDAARNAQKVMKLTDEERERLARFGRGQGLMITEKHRVKVKFEATKEETEEYFNTKVD